MYNYICSLKTYSLVLFYFGEHIRMIFSNAYVMQVAMKESVSAVVCLGFPLRLGPRNVKVCVKSASGALAYSGVDK